MSDRAVDEGVSDTQRSVAAYVADFARELTTVARAGQLEFLAYLLDMARLEATMIADEDRVRRSPRISAS